MMIVIVEEPLVVSALIQAIQISSKRPVGQDLDSGQLIKSAELSLTMGLHSIALIDSPLLKIDSSNQISMPALEESRAAINKVLAMIAVVVPTGVIMEFLSLHQHNNV